MSWHRQGCSEILGLGPVYGKNDVVHGRNGQQVYHEESLSVTPTRGCASIACLQGHGKLGAYLDILCTNPS
jgi:hypothetical protein